MRVRALAALLVLTACVPERGAETPSPSPEPMSRSEVAACHADFGEVVVDGWNIEVCQRQLSDGGQSCSTGSDCEGMCLAETHQCSAHTPMFGCLPIIEDGENVTICFE